MVFLYVVAPRERQSMVTGQPLLGSREGDWDPDAADGRDVDNPGVQKLSEMQQKEWLASGALRVDCVEPRSWVEDSQEGEGEV